MSGCSRARPGDEPTFHAPCFVVTRRAHEIVTKTGGTSYIFVTAGIEAALDQAKAAAEGQDVLVNGGADTGRQYLNSGLLDEVQLHLVPVVLGAGAKLLDGVAAGTRLVPLDARCEPSVTHLTYATQGSGAS